MQNHPVLHFAYEGMDTLCNSCDAYCEGTVLWLKSDFLTSGGVSQRSKQGRCGQEIQVYVISDGVPITRRDICAAAVKSNHFVGKSMPSFEVPSQIGQNGAIEVGLGPGGTAYGRSQREAAGCQQGTTATRRGTASCGKAVPSLGVFDVCCLQDGVLDMHPSQSTWQDTNKMCKKEVPHSRAPDKLVQDETGLNSRL